MKNFMIWMAKEIAEASHDKCRLGVLVADVNVATAPDELYKRIAQQEASSRTAMTKETLDAHEGVKAAKEVYRNLKVTKLADKKPSQEALWLRLIDGKSLYKINNVVDAQNLVSIQAVRSIGSYDLDKLQGSIVFRPGNEGEHYPSTKKRTMDLAQLPLLADDLGPFGSPTSDSDRALIRPETKRVVSIIYAFDDDREDSSLLAQLNQLRSHFERFCGAENCRTSIVSPGEFIEIHEPSVGIEKGIVV